MFEETKHKMYQINYVYLHFKLEIIWFFEIFQLITAGGQNIEKKPSKLILIVSFCKAFQIKIQHLSQSALQPWL